MTTFVILAAGKGTRVGRVGVKLHKSLLPLNGRAVLSHLLDLAPSDARLVIVIGDRGEQIIDYVHLAHPTFADAVEFVWDRDPQGPGSSLLRAQDTVGADDMIYASCDTLWEPDPELWKLDGSWMGVAHVPAGTDPTRWCRVIADENDAVELLLDKVPDPPRLGSREYAFVGLGRIVREDLEAFWHGLAAAGRHTGEYRDPEGFRALIGAGLVAAARVDWTDVGDEAGYRRAVARRTGYDWTKLDQATYVLPDENRVVKYHADRTTIDRRYARAIQLGGDVAPETVSQRGDMLAYEYVPGTTAYEVADDWDRGSSTGAEVTQAILDWFTVAMWSRKVHPNRIDVARAALRFYQYKTAQRITMLRPPLRDQAADAVRTIKYLPLARGTIAGVWHGDLNHGNIIVTPNGGIWGIDWREDFAGETAYGDLRYDVAKLLAGTVVHWGNARRGDFRPWDDGPAHARVIRDWIEEHTPDQAQEIEIIGALSLLNSAPLHAEPLDEILVARGCAWLEEVL